MPISAPSFVDPNAAAASNARGALGNIANFLYEQAVTKPAVQAQTAQTQAQTQATQQNTAVQAIGIPSLKQQAIFATHPGISKNTLTSTRPQSTDTSTGANSPQSSTTSDVTGPAGDGQSGPAPASAMSPQLPNTPAGGTVNQAGSSTQGASSETGVSAPQPGTLIQKPRLAPIDSDELSPVSLTRPSTPAGTPGQPGATNTPPATGMSTTPSITAPVSPSAPVNQPETFDLRQHLGDDIASYPPWKQDQILDDLRAPFEKAKIPVSDAQLVAHYREQQSAYYPSAMQRVKGMVPTTAEVNGFKFVNPNASEEVGGTAGAPPGNQPLMMAPNGTYVANPAYATPEKVKETEDTLATFDQLNQQAQAARDIVKNHPNIVGPVMGTGVGGGLRWAQQATGLANSQGKDGLTDYEARDQMGQFLSGQFLSSLSQLHVGRVLETEYQAVQQKMAHATSTPKTWDTFFEKTLTPYLDKARQAQEILLKTQTGQTLTPEDKAFAQKFDLVAGPQSRLPQVNLSPSVGAPGAAASVPTLTPEQAKAAPKGTHYKTVDGRELWK